MNVIKMGFLSLNERTQETYLKPMRTDPHLEVIGTCEESAQNLEKAEANDVKVTKFGHYAELLENVDAVVITSSHGNHFRQIRQAIEAGVHTLFEQPLCLSPAELFEISQMMRGSTVAMASFGRQFDPLCNGAKALLQVLGNDYGALRKVSLLTHLGPAKDDYEKDGFFELSFAQDYEVLRRLLGFDSYSFNISCRTDKSYLATGVGFKGIQQTELKLEAYRVKQTQPQNARIRMEFANGETLIYKDDGLEEFNKNVRDKQMCRKFVDVICGNDCLLQSPAEFLSVLTQTVELKQAVCHSYPG